jgi:hypothetical protein
MTSSRFTGIEARRNMMSYTVVTSSNVCQFSLCMMGSIDLGHRRENVHIVHCTVERGQIRLAMATFWRTFHHDGKYSPAWCGWGKHALPLSLYLPSRAKLWCTLQLKRQIHSSYFCSTLFSSAVVKKPLPEAKFLDIIRTKVLRVFLLAVHSHLY